jgi:hypothetical protein
MTDEEMEAALREFATNLAANQVGEDPEISRIVNEHFWDIFEDFR